VDVANQRWDRSHSTEGWTTVKTGLPNGVVVITVS
jgi:hypothetical protein